MLRIVSRSYDRYKNIFEFRCGAIYYLLNFLIFLFNFNYVERVSEEQNINHSVDSFWFLLLLLLITENLPVVSRRCVGIIFFYKRWTYYSSWFVNYFWQYLWPLELYYNFVVIWTFVWRAFESVAENAGKIWIVRSAICNITLCCIGRCLDPLGNLELSMRQVLVV